MKSAKNSGQHTEKVATLNSMQKNDWLNIFVEKNIWAIMVLVVSGVIVFTTVKFTVSANAQDISTNSRDIENLTTKVESLQSLVERIIVLEEHDKNFSEDLIDLKSDVRSIGRAVGAKDITSPEE